MLTLEGVTKSFAGAGEGSEASVRPALAAINLTLTAGEFVTVVGSNGAGKTTLLNAIAGTISPDRGRILLDGRDITGWPEHRRAAYVGRVFQDPAMGTAPSLTVEENLALALGRGSRRGMARAVTTAARRLFRSHLARVGMGLESRLGVRAGYLSGGQRQALALIMATLTRPRVLLLDEHTASLDPRAASEVLELTRRLVAQEGFITLMVTHNLRHALEAGQRTLIMHQGRIVLDLEGSRRRQMSVPELMEAFAQACGQELTDDELLLSAPGVR